MTSIIKNIFEDNLIEKCIKDSFLDKNCIIGSSTLFFSLLIFFLNIIALFKLAHYYKKINFETNLILFSIFQVIIIQLAIITSYEILISLFFLIQIFIITLIIRKFVILSKKPNQPYKKNGLFILLNTINMLLFLFYTMFLIKNSKENSFSIILLYSLFYFLSTVILTFYSNSLVQLIKKLKKSELQNSSNSIIQVSKEQNKEEENNNSMSITVLSFNDIFNNNEMFYSMRRKQIKPLYKINMICSLSEFLLMFSILLIPYDNFNQDHYKISPKSLLGYILLYLYLFICLFNVSANFFCFFWRIRKQYKEEINNNKNGTKKLIDNRYLRRETIIMEKEEPKQVNDFIENDNNKKDPIKLEKSIYISSFCDMSDEKDESLFVKPQDDNDKNNGDNNNTDNDNELHINGKKIGIDNEISANNELLDPLNNHFINRESIPYTIDSDNGINRNTTNSISKIE